MRSVDFSVLACSHLDMKGTDTFIVYPTEFANVDPWLVGKYFTRVVGCLVAKRLSNKDVNCL